MSQKKVDARKQSKGDMLHNAKKQSRITVGIVAAVLVIIGALVSVITYSSGYDKGEKKGYADGYENGVFVEKFVKDGETKAEAPKKKEFYF